MTPSSPKATAAANPALVRAGVVNGATLAFEPDPDWSVQAGTVIIDPARPYYTIPQGEGISFTDARIFTFTMRIDETTTSHFYDIEFALAGQPGFHYNDEHFYVQVLPEPGTAALAGVGAVLWLTGRRLYTKGALGQH